MSMYYEIWNQGVYYRRGITGAPGAGDQNGSIVIITNASSLPGYHDDAGPSTRASIWIISGISMAFMLLRVYCKFLKHRGLYWDDYFLIGAWLAMLATTILTTIAIAHGYGRHAWAIADSEANVLTLSGIMSVTFAITGQAWSKTSFALTLYRLGDQWMKRAIWVIIIFVNILMAMAALFFWIPCRPLEKAWRPLTVGKCWDPQVIVRFFIVVSCFSGIMDLTLAFLPWKIVMGLQMKFTEKVGVAVAMSMGVFAAASAFIKASYVPLLADADFNYQGSHLVIWGVAETAVTIMAASIPVMRVLLKQVVSTSNSNGGGYNRTDPDSSNPMGNPMGNSANVHSSSGKRRSSFGSSLSNFKGSTKTKAPEVYGMTNISERSLPSSVSTMPLHPQQQITKEQV